MKAAGVLEQRWVFLRLLLRLAEASVSLAVSLSAIPEKTLCY